MKRLTLLLSFILTICTLYSCAPSTSSENKKTADIEGESKPDDNKEKPLAKVVCKNEEKSGEGEDAILIKNCQFGNIQTRSEGYPDNKGRYSYAYEISFNGKKVKNEAIFNEKMPELLSKLNEKILKDYKEYYNAEDTRDCFEGMDKNPKFTMNDMGIDFDEDKIIFNISFGLSGACMSVDGTNVSLSMEELAPYLKK
jgi:hypothetical protein